MDVEDREEADEEAELGPLPRPSELPESIGAGLVFAKVSESLLGESEPLRVGRYAIQERLGSGGMNTVWSAWDEQLQRRVAIKFLHSALSAPDTEQRLQREAQALARLSHPNVIPVFDVGRHHGRVWIAMEHVAGVNLRQWAQQVRTRGEILERWVAAGRGLAAIHAAGLVHRDVKPANVLLGDDGRVRVIDLGLVRASEGSEVGTQISGEDVLAAELTAPAGFMGTPAYAAPEQHEGRTDARSDQYSYCVSVWEALVGERPDVDRRRPDGRIPLPAGVRLPARVHTALCRGLSTDPDARFPQMSALLDQLEPRRRWLAPLVVATALVGSAGGFLMGAEQTLVEDEPDPCALAAEPIAGAWSPTRREVVQQTLESKGLDGAVGLLDEWAERWGQTARTACEDVHLRRTVSTDALDRRHVCLERRRLGFEVLVQAIETESSVDPHQVIAGLAELPEPLDCLGEAVLASELDRPPPEHTAEIASLRSELIATRTGLGREVALNVRIADARALLGRSETLGWAPLRGEAELVVGQLHSMAGEARLAREYLGRAIDVAETTRDLELLVDAWGALQRVERVLEFDVERTGWTLERREALFRRYEPSRRQRARARGNRGQWLQMQGRSEEAERALREAITLLEEAGPSAGWEAATFTRALGIELSHLGRRDEADALFDRARALEHGRALGAQVSTVSSSTARPAFQAGVLAYGKGELDEAEEHLREALALAIAEQGPRGGLVARTHLVLAAVANGRGDLDSLRHHGQRADALYVERFGPMHPVRSDSLSALAAVASHEGRWDAAVELGERALAIVSEHFDPETTERAAAEINLAEALLETGASGRAGPLLRRGLATLEAKFSADAPELAQPLRVLGAVRLAEGSASAAREPLLLALTLLDHDEPAARGQTLWVLARVERTLGEPALATTHAREALTLLGAAGPAHHPLVVEIQGWLLDGDDDPRADPAPGDATMPERTVITIDDQTRDGSVVQSASMTFVVENGLSHPFTYIVKGDERVYVPPTLLTSGASRHHTIEGSDSVELSASHAPLAMEITIKISTTGK